MERKAIFLDIDGTLTEPGCNVPPESAIRAVKAARDKGNFVFLCSGRNYGMLSPLLAYEFDGVVASSGGYVICRDEVIYDCPMTEGQRDGLLEFLRRRGVFCTVESRDGSYTDEGFKEFLRQNAGQGGNSELLRWREQIEKSLNILPMAQYKGQPVYKVVAMSETRGALEEAERALGGEFHVCIQDGDDYGYANGEIMRSDFDKGTGVRRVCEALGLPLRNSVAFGDSMNDKEMMETAGFSVCMENGSPALKQIASAVCPAVTEDGLYRAFRKCGLM